MRMLLIAGIGHKQGSNMGYACTNMNANMNVNGNGVTQASEVPRKTIGGLTALRVSSSSLSSAAAAEEDVTAGVGVGAGVEGEARRLAREEADDLMSPSARSSAVKVMKRTKSIGSSMAAGSWTG